MMGGAGFMKDMVTTTKNNRSLLKGDSHPYSNFDKSYITDYKVKRKKKVPSIFFKKASPEYYKKLRNSIRHANKRVLLKKMILLVMISMCLGIGSWFFLFS